MHSLCTADRLFAGRRSKFEHRDKRPLQPHKLCFVASAGLQDQHLLLTMGRGSIHLGWGHQQVQRHHPAGLTLSNLAACESYSLLCMHVVHAYLCKAFIASSEHGSCWELSPTAGICKFWLNLYPGVSAMIWPPVCCLSLCAGDSALIWPAVCCLGFWSCRSSKPLAMVCRH